MASHTPFSARLVAGYLGSFAARRALLGLTQKLRPGRPRLEFYWRADDAYSYIVAQLVARLVDAYPVDLEVHVVPAAAAEVDPEPQLRSAHAIRDAHALAKFYDLTFPELAIAPTSDRVRRANAVALVDRPPREHLSVLLQLSAALFGHGGGAVSELVRTLGAVEGTVVTTSLELGYATLRKRGHYQSATLRYNGEWYEGPHRVLALQERLRSDGLGDAPVVLLRRSPPLLEVAPPNTPLEMWVSFRSPYSYLAVEQVAPWVRGPLGGSGRFQLRPVLPMVMRGLQVPKAKKLNLLKDAKREADRLGIPFGRVADPLGDGALRCIAVYAAVEASGRGFDFTQQALRGIWAEGIDVATNVGLYTLAERAGVGSDEVDAALADLQRGLDLAESHRVSLHDDAALWGVPCFRVGDFATWGQDRLPLVAHALGLPA